MENNLTNEDLKKDFDNSSFNLVNAIIEYASKNMKNELKESDEDGESQVKKVLDRFKMSLKEEKEQEEDSEK